MDILLSEKKIQKKVCELAKQVKKRYPSKVFCVVVLNGALVFFSDLMHELRRIGVEVSYSCVKLSSYEGKKSNGNVLVELDAKHVKGADVLVVEDIVDSGATLNFLIPHLKKQGAKRVRLCALLSKPGKHNVPIDFLGFEISDKFVVGYGLDYNQRYRDLPFIGIKK
ncbi:MAG: hypoxanthine phosphoribosyltransferase [Nanoarchaeota archaeon]|nr:hypoxanthine phosphoribosyltransferase [Nanoarchaeota archaeon]